MTQPFDEPFDDFEEEQTNRSPGLVTILILLLLIVTMLSSLVWPILYNYANRYEMPPTPTPSFLQEI